MNKFSVIIPTFNRVSKIINAVNSVLQQTYPEFEVIVIDDGGKDSPYEELMKIRDKRLIYVRKNREQRLIARNTGMRIAKYEWICWMDDDDEYLPKYLERFNQAIINHKEFSVFQCAAQFFKLIEGKVVKLRILNPMRLPNVKFTKDMPHFRSGAITTGQFIFKKKCLDWTGYLPDTPSYGQFAINSGIPGYGWKDPDHRHKERWVQVMGNPWGEDYYMFYKLTRFYNAYAITEVLYKKNCR